jgi:hypothetical protein
MPNRITLTQHRAVLASPSDVQNEREIVRGVIDEINRDTANPRGVHVELVRWETHAAPGFHSSGPPGIIDPVLRIEDADLFIGIFWRTFGTPTQDGMTGTEHEFKIAYESWKQFRRPQIMFYFNDGSYKPRNAKEAKQWARVLEFKEDFPDEGLWWNYSGESEFKDLIRSHIRNYVMHQVMHQQSDDTRSAASSDYQLGISNAAWIEARLIDLLGSPEFYEIVQKFNKLAPPFIRLLILQRWEDAEKYLRSCGLSEFARNHYMSVGREAIAFTNFRLPVGTGL